MVGVTAYSFWPTVIFVITALILALIFWGIWTEIRDWLERRDEDDEDY